MSNSKWLRLKYMPGTPLYGKERVSGGAEHRRISHEAALDGTVLLKNEGGCLPFKAGTKLAVFGKAQTDYVKGGYGSGDVTVEETINILQGLQQKEKEGKVSLFAPLVKLYSDYAEQQKEAYPVPGTLPEAPVCDGMIADAADFADAALVILCRFSGESYDRSNDPDSGDYYLSADEKELIRKVTEKFEKTVVCLNIGSAMDTTWFINNARIPAVLLPWQAGMEGGAAAADVLCGDAFPAGRLVDTFVDSLDAYPSTEGFMASDTSVEYIEDIYVGYRYFETVPGAKAHVCYPFGFGLNYTEFETSGVEMGEADGTFTVTAEVKNVGSAAGRDVLQVYCEAPQGRLGKSARVLTGFAKTKALLPGESEKLTVTFAKDAFASYDDSGKVCKSAWLLEKGCYQFYVGANVRDAKKAAFEYVLDADLILSQLSEKCAPTDLSRRLLPDGSYETLPVRPSAYKAPEGRELLPFDGQQPVEKLWQIPFGAGAEPTVPQLIDVYDGKLTLDEFIDNLDMEQMVYMLGAQSNRGVANTFGIGNLPLYGIPNVMTADGPAGLRIRPECEVYTTAFPCSTMMACTWNPELVYAVGRAGAEEVLENGIGVWLTPAINIHRSPLCGRNFEYYSEDPLIAGAMATAAVQGMQSMGIAASLKHFACNNKETNRRDSDSRLSERALREIYLKGFEMCVKNADPWTVMCSYNVLNGVRVSENRELLTDILRDEWGYDGLVITDWWTYGIQYAEINAGVDVKMACGMPEHTLAKLADGTLDPAAVRNAVKHVLSFILKLA